MKKFSIFGLLAVLIPVAKAQDTARVCVVDEGGRALPAASVSRGSGAGSGSALRPGSESETQGPTAPLTGADVTGVDVTGVDVTGVDGCVAVAVAADGKARGVMSAGHAGFATAVITEPGAGATVQVILRPEAVQQSVTVTADRGLAGVEDQANSTVVLDAEQLAAAPGLALDDRLHQVAGFTLYRRTSSWTANPTTEGVSLRGLGSTAASRSLVVSDEVPLNDPFGGWIHWDEIPALAIREVELERGGAADLYGSSAIGGVIAIHPVTPSAARPLQLDMDALGATENSASADLLVAGSSRALQWLLAGSGVDTGGYVATAPAARGTVDSVSDVAEESGRVELRSPSRADGKAVFLRGNVLNESRGNGTPDQTNGTRLWRFEGGGDADTGPNHAVLRIFGDRETYRQSFSAIAANRNTETLTRLQRVPTDEFGASFTGSRVLPHALIAGLGVDGRDVRATDAESPVSGGVATSTTDISAHQRDVGGYAEGIWQPKGWSLAASVRVDSFRTFDGHQTATNSTAVTVEPTLNELVASPHAGVVRNLPHGFALTASGFRAFRGPTMNELYRTGQVGSQTTLANPSLEAERATGFETGVEFSDPGTHGHALGSLRASYFWTEVNRPVSAVTLAQTATTQTLQRQNLGQIRSRGLSLDAVSARWHGFDATFGYQLAIATVTAFNTSSAAQANLTGKWIPEVPRQLLTATVNQSIRRVADFHLIASYTGQSFDDASNQYLLHPYARFDLSADRAIFSRLVPGLSLYGGAQNLLNRSIDAGRTPVLTLAPPRLVQAGLRYTLSR